MTSEKPSFAFLHCPAIISKVPGSGNHIPRNDFTIRARIFDIIRRVELGTTVRAATLGDAERIFALIGRNTDMLVPRSLGSVVESIDRFVVAECGGAMAGCAAYQIHPEIGDAEAATVEIVSLVVKSMFRRRGIGRLLVEAVMSRAAAFRPREVIALTFTPAFFASLGFSETPKTEIMHKLYTGCINCTKHMNPYTCPEVAMRRRLDYTTKGKDSKQ